MTRTIKFNIKYFIEDYIYSIEASDEEDEKELLDSFNYVFTHSNRNVQEGIYRYLLNLKVGRDYKQVSSIIEKIEQYFKQLDTLLKS